MTELMKYFLATYKDDPETMAAVEAAYKEAYRKGCCKKGSVRSPSAVRAARRLYTRRIC